MREWKKEREREKNRQRCTEEKRKGERKGLADTGVSRRREKRKEICRFGGNL